MQGRRAMGYYDQNFLNYYYYMASQFAVSDRWFSPVASKSVSNRIATMSGGTSRDWCTIRQTTITSRNSLYRIFSRNSIQQKSRGRFTTRSLKINACQTMTATATAPAIQISTPRARSRISRIHRSTCTESDRRGVHRNHQTIERGGRYLERLLYRHKSYCAA